MEGPSGLLSVWGKSDADTHRTMPLLRHLEDSAAVAAVLWDHWLPASVRAVISAGLPEGQTDGRTLYSWLAGVHDIGKATPGFAVKIRVHHGFEGVLDDLARHGLVTVPRQTSAKEPPHCRVGQLILTRWLDEKYPATDPSTTTIRRNAALRSYAGVVGAHHGTPPTVAELQALRGHPGVDAGQEAWRAVQRALLERMAEQTGAVQRIPAWLRCPLPRPAQVLLAGAVVVADWLASDSNRFTYDDPRTSAERATAAVTEWELPRPWAAAAESATEADAMLHQRFPALRGRPARPVQRAAVSAARTMAGPGLIVVEAGTGDGKTEAALLAAEVMATRFGQGGVLFALPTQATSDGIFPRVRDWVEALPGVGRTSMFLAHGRAGLNEDYRGLIRGGRIRAVSDDVSGEGGSRSSAVVTSWLQGRRKGVLADFVIGTIDQVLFGALKARHLALRHLALAGKVVVIDEVHAADAFMRVYLTRVLEWLGAYRTPVVLLSATLPDAIRAELVDAYARGAGLPRLASVVDLAHPRVTVVDGSPTADTSVAVGGPAEMDREVDVIAVPDDDAWVQDVVDAVEAGACVAVIRNTVGRSQAAYALLTERLGRDRTRLLHSRFLAVHRMAKEREIRDLLGPPPRDGSPDRRPAGLVVVGTQVLEQSLDIDVDLLVTDVAPVDLVLQRVGRLHRHARPASARPLPVRRARVLVICPALVDGVPEVSRADDAIYGAAAVIRALSCLQPHLAGRPLRVPSDVPRLVREAYAERVETPPGWADALAVADREAATRVQRQRTDAEAFLVGAPDDGRDLVGWLARGTDEPDDDGGTRSRARVRDTEDSVDVIVVRRVDGVIRPMPEVGLPEDLDLPTELGAPTAEVARRLAACTVSLPGVLTSAWSVDRVIADLERQSRGFTGWQESDWLKGELVLVLEDGAATVAGWRLAYDIEHGLTHERVAGPSERGGGR